MTLHHSQTLLNKTSLVWVAALAWTGIMAGIVLLNESERLKTRDSIALAEARTTYQKDLSYRFAAIERENPPKGALVHDLSAHPGTRLVVDSPGAHSTLGTPEPWELGALAALKAGGRESLQFGTVDGTRVLFYMGPVVSQASCAACHGNTASGEVRGGLSVRLPVGDAIANAVHQNHLQGHLIHGAIWLLGLAGLCWFHIALRREEERIGRAFEVVERNEQRYRQIFQNAPVAYQIMDQEGTLTAVNEAWISLTGHGTCRGVRFKDLLFDDDKSKFAACLPKLLELGFVSSEELRILRPDRSLVMVLISARVERSPLAEPLLIHCVLNDVTNQRRTQLALEQSEQRYRLIADNTGDITFIYNNVTDRFEYVSPSAYRLLKVRPEEALGRSLTHFLTPESARFVAEAHPQRLQAVQKGDHSQLRQTYELDVLTPRGLALPMEIQSTVLLDELGNPVRMIGVCRDIARRRQDEQALSDSARRFRTIIEQSHAAYLRLDKNGCYEDVNGAWLALHGYTERGEVLGKPLSLTQVPEDLPAAEQLLQRLLSGQQVPPGEFSRRCRDGATAFHSYSLSPVLEEGRVVGVEGFLIDTTQLRSARADSAMLFNEMIDAFALHEILCDASGRPVDYRFLAVNPAFERTTGLKAEAVIGHTALELMPKLERHWIERYGKVALNGESMSFEDFLAPVGRHLFVSAFQPALGRFACVFLDVTDRKLAEAKLEYDEAELAAIHEHVPLMLVLLDSRHQVRRVNRAAMEFAEQNTLGEASPSPGLMLGCFQALNSGKPCGQGTDCPRCPLRLAINDTLENGHSHHNEESSLLVFRGDHPSELILRFSTAQVKVGNEFMVLLCMEDMTHLREAEKHISRQAALLDITSDSICVLSPCCAIEFWNRASQRIFGWSEKESLGCDWETLLVKKESPAFREGFNKAREQGEWTGELRALAKDGSPLVLQARASLITGDPLHPDAVLLVCTNITETKRMEQQFLRMQRLDNLGSLASGIAHDLNNVLAPILMSADLLPPLITSKEHQPMVAMLRDSAKRGAEIVQQLLVFSRGTDIPRHPIDVTKLLREVGMIVSQTFPRNIRLSIACPDQPWQVMGDTTQLHQVLLNLCVNARDAMPEGGLIGLSAANCELDAATAALHPDASPGSYVLIKVSDTGQGIAPDIIDKIFDPFFTTKPTGKGTGLGLSTVLAIVKGHGGFTSLSSQLRVGTEFKVYLPAAMKTALAPAQPELLPDLRGNGETILVIDDESNIKELLRLALTGHNYKVLVASDGAQGLSLYAEAPEAVQVVVTDMMMPHLDGRLCIQCIRQISAEVPILAMSGMIEQQRALEKLGEEKVRFILKPFTIKAMLTAIRQALNQPH